MILDNYDKAILVLDNYDKAILRALDTRGGMVTADVSDHAFGSDRRQRSSNARHVLERMEKGGLVRRIDDRKPVAWVVTSAGLQALAARP